MIRPLAAALLGLGLLAACEGEPPAPRAVVSTHNTNDTRVAKQLFGHVPTASAQRP